MRENDPYTPVTVEGLRAEVRFGKGSLSVTLPDREAFHPHAFGESPACYSATDCHLTKVETPRAIAERALTLGLLLYEEVDRDVWRFASLLT